MSTNKPLILVIVVVFLGFYLMQDPDGLAAATVEEAIRCGSPATASTA